MSNQGHTPGPWSVVGITVGRESGSAFDIVCWLDLTHPDRERRAADGRLIAAAPSLLGALRGLVAQVSETCKARGFSDGPLCEATETARRVLREAGVSS